MFQELSKVNMQEHMEKKNGLSYLSWTYAWSELKKRYPDAVYKIKQFGENQLPYVYDENTGYMVFTKATDGNEWKEMWLCVMDGNNKAMLNHSYTYKVKEYKDGKWTGGYVEKSVEPATMFDINKTIMRCLVKNIAMFGLGIYIYAGEDYPEGYEMTKDEAEQIKVGFGKYKGVTLKEIQEKDNGYLLWLINDCDKVNEAFKNACILLLESNDTKNNQIKTESRTEIKEKLTCSDCGKEINKKEYDYSNKFFGKAKGSAVEKSRFCILLQFANVL